VRSATLTALGVLALATPALAHPHAPDLSVSGAEVRASLGGSDGTAAYMVITSHGGPDRLLAISCPCAAKAEAHATRTIHGMTMMAPAGPVAIPARGRVAFAPGGLHVMLTGVRGRLVDGSMQPMTLTFEHAGRMVVPFKVHARIGGGLAPMGSMPGMNH
jgi:copper(I)-binding protein